MITDHIFPTGSPLPNHRIAGPPKPKKMNGKIAERVLSGIIERIKPVMKIRELMDKVYSNGYFERHYPEAEQELKNHLHNEAMVAHSKMRAPDHSEPDGDEGKSITININLGKS
jgi:hypothetical protein